MTLIGSGGADDPLRRPLLVAVVLVHVLFVLDPMDVLAPGDPGVIADQMLSGDMPYRDFAFEYPPLAALLFLPCGLVPASLAFNVLAVEAVLFELLLLVVVLRHHPNSAWRYGVLSILVFPFLSGGFDAIVMVALAVSVELLARDDPRGWCVAAVGTAAKVAPGVTWVWARARWRTAVPAGIAGVGVCLSPALVAGFSDDSWIGTSRERGVQAESVAASLAWFSRWVSGSAVEFEYRLRSWELIDAESAGYLMLAVGALLLAVVAWHSRASVDPWLLAFAAILAFMVGNKVLSPQFMAWPAGLAAVLGGRWFMAQVALCVTTSLVYFGDGDLESLSPLIAIRNVGLVALTACAVACVVGQARRPGARPQGVGNVTP